MVTVETIRDHQRTPVAAAAVERAAVVPSRGAVTAACSNKRGGIRGKGQALLPEMIIKVSQLRNIFGYGSTMKKTILTYTLIKKKGFTPCQTRSRMNFRNLNKRKLPYTFPRP